MSKKFDLVSNYKPAGDQPQTNILGNGANEESDDDGSRAANQELKEVYLAGNVAARRLKYRAHGYQHELL